MLKHLFFLALLATVFCDSSTKPEDSVTDVTAVFTSSAAGCGNSVVFKHDALYTQFIEVSTNDDSLMVDTTTKTFTITPQNSKLSVKIDKYPFQNGSAYAAGFPFCNDIIDHNLIGNQPDEYVATSGTVTIRRSAATTTGLGTFYTITIELKDVFFENADKVKLTVKYLTFENVSVGINIG